MAHPIPKLEWKHFDLSGTTNIGSDLIAITDTSDLEVGMLIEDAEFASGTTIIAVNAGDVQMSSNATAGSIATRSFRFEFEFRFPSVINDLERVRPKRRVKTSVSGIQQVGIDHIEFELKVEFDFQTPAEIETLRDSFYINHAMGGNDFRYFLDQTTAVYKTYEMDTADFKTKQLKNRDLYGFTARFRRVEP